MRRGAGVRTGAAGVPRPLGAHGRPPLSGTGCVGTRESGAHGEAPNQSGTAGIARLWPTEAGFSLFRGRESHVQPVQAASAGHRGGLRAGSGGAFRAGGAALLSGTEGDLGPPGRTLAVAAELQTPGPCDLSDLPVFHRDRDPPRREDRGRLFIDHGMGVVIGETARSATM